MAGTHLLETNWSFLHPKPHLAVLTQQIYDYLFKYEGLYQEELQEIFGEDYSAL